MGAEGVSRRKTSVNLSGKRTVRFRKMQKFCILKRAKGAEI